MNLFQALAYFWTEATLNVVRGWRVSLLAVFTIAVSLFVGGTFLLLSHNLSATVDRWEEETRVVVYLAEDAPEAALGELAANARERAWVVEVVEVDRELAQERFAELFPTLSDLVEGWGEEPLPASLEIALDPLAAGSPEADRWLESLRQRTEVAMVDNDRDWLGQLGTVIALIRGIGVTLALVLLSAAVFTIASVIRLTAYLYRDEIDIMRLVGATEFFIRGPFYVEGLMQGLLGGALAAGSLFFAHRALAGKPVSGMIAGEFLSPSQMGFLVLLGGLAGLAGAITSLRREKLGATEA